MEKAKPSKKKAYYKNRKPETAKVNTNFVNWKQVGKGSYPDPFAPKEEVEVSTWSKRRLEQPSACLADLDEIWQDTNVGEDFETLLNVPLSSNYFVLKSEKNWTLDSSAYEEFFSVDVKNLSTIIECIPYNQYVDVDDEYFTRDELTYINNTAEQARRAYDRMLESLRKDTTESSAAVCDPLRTGESADASSPKKPLKSAEAEKREDSSQNIEEDLDFLLSLKEPVRSHPFSVAPPIKKTSEETKTKNIPTATKSIDLEKWLDLVLDD